MEKVRETIVCLTDWYLFTNGQFKSSLKIIRTLLFKEDYINYIDILEIYINHIIKDWPSLELYYILNFLQSYKVVEPNVIIPVEISVRTKVDVMYKNILSYIQELSLDEKFKLPKLIKEIEEIKIRHEIERNEVIAISDIITEKINIEKKILILKNKKIEKIATLNNKIKYILNQRINYIAELRRKAENEIKKIEDIIAKLNIKIERNKINIKNSIDYYKEYNNGLKQKVLKCKTYNNLQEMKEDLEYINSRNINI